LSEDGDGITIEIFGRKKRKNISRLSEENEVPIKCRFSTVVVRMGMPVRNRLGSCP